MPPLDSGTPQVLAAGKQGTKLVALGTQLGKSNDRVERASLKGAGLEASTVESCSGVYEDVEGCHGGYEVVEDDGEGSEVEAVLLGVGTPLGEQEDAVGWEVEEEMHVGDIDRDFSVGSTGSGSVW
jgi:hypothetical protein